MGSGPMYYSYKNYFSVVPVAVADSNYCPVYACVLNNGWDNYPDGNQHSHKQSREVEPIFELETSEKESESSEDRFPNFATRLVVFVF